MGGCLGLARMSGPSHNRSSSTVSPSDLLSPEELKDAEYMSQLVAKGVPVHGDSDRDSLIATGRGICAVLKTPGGDLVDVLGYVGRQQGQLTSEQRAVLAPAALSVYCPEWHP